MTKIFNRFSRVKALVIGDLMVDEYLWGRVERISPEAPVPVVAIEKENLTLGGSGNVINNLRAMNAQVCATGIVGSDRAGTNLLDILTKMKVETSGVCVDNNRPTTQKARVIASNQQIVRIDKETCQSISSATHAKILYSIEKNLPGCDLVIISDYNKGMIDSQLVRQTTELAKKHTIPVLADPKSRNFSKYSQVSLLTPNQKEAAIAANMTIDSMEDLHKAGTKILDTTDIDKLIITCGKDGMLLFQRNKKIQAIASRARQVFDVSGAGDTVISFLGLGLAVGMNIEDSAWIANAAAGIVVGKIGTATVTPEELAIEMKDKYNSLGLPHSITTHD